MLLRRPILLHMSSPEIFNRAEDDSFGRDIALVEHPPAAERLENALGGELTRFLLAALAGSQAPSRADVG
jgi:hypothetical protein